MEWQLLLLLCKYRHGGLPVPQRLVVSTLCPLRQGPPPLTLPLQRLTMQVLLLVVTTPPTTPLARYNGLSEPPWTLAAESTITEAAAAAASEILQRVVLRELLVRRRNEPNEDA